MLSEQRNRELAASDREANKIKLTSKMEQIKKETAMQQEKYNKELEAKKTLEKDKLEAQEKSIKSELDELKKVSDIKIATEQNRIKSKLEALNNEKTVMQDHYNKLLDQENIAAEARELILKNNNDDIVKLLSKYNPKWQDAGQSLGESLVNGLNSKKDSMQKTIQDMLNIPTMKFDGKLDFRGIGSTMNSVAKPSVNNSKNRMKKLCLK